MFVLDIGVSSYPWFLKNRGNELTQIYPLGIPNNIIYVCSDSEKSEIKKCKQKWANDKEINTDSMIVHNKYWSWSLKNIGGDKVRI